MSICQKYSLIFLSYFCCFLCRTNDTSSSGQCGLAMNPVAALGGYVLSEDDVDLDPTQIDDEKDKKKWNVHHLPFASALTIWFGNNLEVCKFTYLYLFHC